MALLPGLAITPLAHTRAEVAADILALMQTAHEQEAQWLQLPPLSPPLSTPLSPPFAPPFAPLLQTVPGIQRSSHFHLGALQAGRVVGVLVVAPDDEPGQLDIATLVVHPGVQRQGVARSLVQDALRRGPGVVFSVSAATANAAANRLYLGLGFVPYRQGLLADVLPITKLRRTAP